MKKRIFISLVAIAFLLVGIRVGTTSAYFISEDKVTNNFQNGDIDIEVEEPDFEPPSEGWSGQKINKKVQVKNESIIPVLVRVNITPSPVTSVNPIVSSYSCNSLFNTSEAF